MTEEIGNSVKEGELIGIGGNFGDDPAGVVVYRYDEKESADLRYIYVEPEYRRLGVGTELIDATECSYFDFTYEATGDRVNLEPFFTAVDIYTEKIEYPFSELSVKKIKEEFLKNGVLKAKNTGSFYSEMDGEKKKAFSDWMQSEFGESAFLYTTDRPKSIFNFKDGHTDSVVLVSEMNSDTLNLDYIFSQSRDSVEMLGMLRRVFEKALSDYGTEAYIRMMPKMEDGMKIYNKLFGEVTESIPVVFAV